MNFQGVNRLFVLAFENGAQGTSNKRYYHPNVGIKDYNVIIGGKNFFNQAVKNTEIKYENIGKIATGQGDYFTIGCLLFYTVGCLFVIYFKNYYKNYYCSRFKQTTSARCWS